MWMWCGRTNLQGASTHSTNLYVTHAAGAAAYCTHRPVLMPRERRHDFVRWLPRSVNIHNNAHRTFSTCRLHNIRQLSPTCQLNCIATPSKVNMVKSHFKYILNTFLMKLCINFSRYIACRCMAVHCGTSVVKSSTNSMLRGENPSGTS